MTDAGETFAEFRGSFSYGTRTDLSFKFLKALSDEEGAEFLRSLLEKLGETIDDGDAQRLVRHAFEWQARGYTPAPGAARTWVYEDGPFAHPVRPVAGSRVALLTSGGHFVDDPEPFGVAGMSQEEAIDRIQEFLRVAPELSEIPADTLDDDLQVRHGGYDIRGALADPGVDFPLALLRQLESEGVIGELADPAYSFVGASAQRRLINESGPEWARMLEERGVEAVLLVPV